MKIFLWHFIVALNFFTVHNFMFHPRLKKKTSFEKIMIKPNFGNKSTIRREQLIHQTYTKQVADQARKIIKNVR